MTDTHCSNRFYVVLGSQHSIHAIYCLTETPCGLDFDYTLEDISSEV